MEIVLSALIVLLAALVQGTVGFGFALISVPLLSLILQFQMVVPLVVIYSLVTNLVVIHSLRNSISIRKIWLLIVSGIVGIPFGVFILNYVNAEILKSAVGVLIVLTSFLMIKGYKIKFKQERISYFAAGLVSGI